MVFAKKSLGQNFLMHAQTAERIVDAAHLPESATVLEIGPGTGMLTRVLLSRGYKVIAVEADDALAPELEQVFADEISSRSLQVIHADIRAFDLSTLPAPYHVVANIPYYITGEILRTLLSSTHKPSSVTVLVQKEVAERIARLDADRPKESILSLSVKAYGTPKYRFTVPRGAFRPAPNVDSAVLSVENINQNAFKSPKEEEAYFDLVKTGFSQKRKRLAKNLEALMPSSKVQELFERIALDVNVRAEDVPLSVWRQLAEEVG